MLSLVVSITITTSILVCFFFPPFLFLDMDKYSSLFLLYKFFINIGKDMSVFPFLSLLNFSIILLLDWWLVKARELNMPSYINQIWRKKDVFFLLFPSKHLSSGENNTAYNNS